MNTLSLSIKPNVAVPALVFVHVLLLISLFMPSLAAAATVRCELDASETRIDRGEEVTLEWETSNATEVRIEDDRDHVLLDTDDLDRDDKKDFYDGELTVKPAVTTTYTLTAERSSSDDECEVKVTVNDSVARGSSDSNILVFEQRYQDPIVAGVHLSQVPYTGFSAGPMLTWLFYGLVAVWIGYFVYRARVGRVLARAKSE